MPIYTVTAEDRSWFARCRRSWDFGALARRALEPVNREVGGQLGDAVRAALAVYYFPGMWNWDRGVVFPLVLAAYDEAGGPAASRSVLNGFRRWSPGADRFTPLKVQFDLDVPVPDPRDPERHLARADGERVRYRDRIDVAVVDDEGGVPWLVSHRVVDEFASTDELLLDERGLLACWAWDQIELALPVAGMRYTELRVDPPSVRRSEVPRSISAKEAAAVRLGWDVLAMLDTADDPAPAPDWAWCSSCAFRDPCLAMQRGGDPAPVLAAGFRHRPPDDLEEGRLGGASWGSAAAPCPSGSPPTPRRGT